MFLAVDPIPSMSTYYNRCHGGPSPDGVAEYPSFRCHNRMLFVDAERERTLARTGRMIFSTRYVTICYYAFVISSFHILYD